MRDVVLGVRTAAARRSVRTADDARGRRHGQHHHYRAADLRSRGDLYASTLAYTVCSRIEPGLTARRVAPLLS